MTIVDGALQWNEHPDPEPWDTELVVAVHGAGINNADLMQRLGFYPAPPGWPQDIPGMEFAGEVVATGRRCTRFSVGDRVMAVVGGGAQAELAVVDESCAMAVPPDVAWPEAGGFPEAFTTAYDALFTQCRMAVGDRVLVTGAAGGVGSAAVQLAAATAGPDEALGLGPFDVVLELVGAGSLPAVVAAMALGGRIAVIGVGGGAQVEVDLLAIMQRRLHISGSTLRSRSLVDKAVVAAAVEHHVVPLLRARKVRVPLQATMSMDRAEDAYAHFAESGKLGKIVLVPPSP
ncbi:MAG TPA: zinc-binding dehydrogenase [Acidimicrobiales bacterium]|nr:zinc-binding dehydrogenase [Acidimicrobiales bacterium]